MRTTPSLPAIAQGGVLSVSGVPLAAQALLAAEVALRERRPVLHVAAHDRDAQIWLSALAFFAPGMEVVHFPAWDCLPYDRVSPSPALAVARMRALARLAEGVSGALVVVTTASAITQRIPPRSALRAVSRRIARGETLEREAFLTHLLEHGYRRAGKVMEQGEFAVRGSILDIFPAGAERAVRIDLFGDEVESIRAFDPLTQVSAEAVESVTLSPLSEVMLTPESIARFRSRYRETFGVSGKDDPLYEAVSSARTYAGMEHWLPLFYEQLETLPEYLPDALLTSDRALEGIVPERDDLIRDYYRARQSHAEKRGDEPHYLPLVPEALYLDAASWEVLTQPRSRVTFSSFDAPSASAGDCLLPSSPRLHLRFPGNAAQQWESIAAHLRDAASPSLIACNSQGSLERIERVLKDHAITPLRLSTWKEAQALTGAQVALTALAIDHGFIHPVLTLYSEEDVLGERVIRTQKRRKSSEAFMAEAAAFAPGDYVVHREHGIGRFEGLVTVEAAGARHDCLKLIYADDARLFLPVENIDLITRYGNTEGIVTLDKLGGVHWQKRKAELKNRLKLAAEALIQTAAERAIRRAPRMEAAQEAYDEFAARFPYAETEDQAASIEDVLADLRSGRPMDRLICGDVGFGKTEVALRAACAVAASPTPAQVAVIAPTTLLARQHAQRFTERFAGFPFRVRSLSRLVGAKEAAETKAMIASGEAHIVVGTHALLAKDVQFKNLGLLIIDEEQHFGVAQKEKLKALKHDVHVLTLSATPIPRTLQLALSGARELSLITTPPADRLAVRSYVMPFDAVVIREAILREYHRGGRVFYVTPRVKYMPELKVKLEALVPEIRIAAAHGGMAARELDKVMNAFYEGAYDLLLSTAIVESGIDIASANTMIIDRADMFGLSQLYQLRGRVGRGKQRAYAYFTLPHRKTLTHDATRRLEVMQQLDGLGAGFTLASHDMDMRGFGNILGEEQSGHIREVGIELYQSMLEEAVAERKRSLAGEAAALPDHDWSPAIHLGIAALIPESYVADLTLRLGLYRRAAGMESEAEIESFAAELVDRFGSLPEEVAHFIEILRIKRWCKQAGIARIDAGPKGAVIAFRDNRFAKPESLIALAQKQPALYRLRADQKLGVLGDWEDLTTRLRGVESATRHIAELAAS